MYDDLALGDDARRTALLRLAWDIAARRLLRKAARMAELLRKAGFNPGQLRIPVGEAGAGRWTDGDAAGDLIRVGARGRQTVTIRVGNRSLEATPAQASQLALASAHALSAMHRVREIDPGWRPTPGAYDPNSVEGHIRTAEAQARQAETRLPEISSGRLGDNQGPPLGPASPRAGTGTASPSPTEVIGSYRAITGMPDVASGSARASSDGTVALAEVDGRLVLGVNSNAPGYTASDQAAAEAMRLRLVDQYPNVMANGNLGHFPNNALFHAEANALMRAAEANGGTLSGKTLTINVDRELCRSCQTVLPLVGIQVGNPTVRFRDGKGRVKTLRNGDWIE